LNREPSQAHETSGRSRSQAECSDKKRTGNARGNRRREAIFSFASPGTRVTEHHPLRAIRPMMDQALAALDAELDALSCTGRPSPPQPLLRFPDSSVAGRPHLQHTHAVLALRPAESFQCERHIDTMPSDPPARQAWTLLLIWQVFTHDFPTVAREAR